MRLPFFTLLIGSCILLFSCKENGKEEIAKIVTEWQDKEIIFPKNLVFTRYGQDIIYPVICTTI